MKMSGLFLAFLATSLMAELSYFERDVNKKQLEQCSAYVTLENDVKTIHLLNGQTMRLIDEYSGDDKTYKILLFTLKGCFLKEKFLIYSDFMPDSEAYHALDLRDGKEIPLDGMPSLCPNEKYFATQADESDRITLYTLEDARIRKIFSHQFPEACSVSSIAWESDTSLQFEVTCDDLYDSQTKSVKAGSKNKFKLHQKGAQWEILAP